MIVFKLTANHSVTPKCCNAVPGEQLFHVVPLDGVVSYNKQGLSMQQCDIASIYCEEL